MYNFRTDMADERRDIYKKLNNLNEIPGIQSEERNDDENIKVSKVIVLDENGEAAIGKPKGTYITIDINNLKIAGDEEIRESFRNSNQRVKRTNYKAYTKRRWNFNCRAWK